MKITIALCTYNGERFLRQQLESYLQQTRLPDELIVCDDGSVDNTLEILHTFAQTAPFPVYIHLNEQCLGQVKNFEKAVRLSMGDIILYSDQDDVWVPEKLQKIEGIFIQRADVGVLFSDAEYFDKDMNSLHKTVWQFFRINNHLQHMILKGEGLKALVRNYKIAGMCIAFRAKYKSALLPFPNTLGTHDHWTVMMIACLSNLTIIQESLVKYRRWEQSTSGTYKVGFDAKRNMNRVLKIPKSSRKNRYKTQIQFFQSVLDRLFELDNVPNIEDKLRLLNGALNHLRLEQICLAKGFIGFL